MHISPSSPSKLTMPSAAAAPHRWLSAGLAVRMAVQRPVRARIRFGRVLSGIEAPVIGKMRSMKLTVIGGTGMICSQVVQKLSAAGHEAVPAALSTGVDLITGKGLDQALEGAEVVVNLANSPTFDEASLGF